MSMTQLFSKKKNLQRFVIVLIVLNIAYNWLFLTCHPPIGDNLNFHININQDDSWSKTDPLGIHPESYLLPAVEQKLQKHYDICVVGAGLSGSVIAEQYASQLGMKSLVIEKRNHIGGNCFDYIDHETNILVNKYGAHLFHTKHYRVWEYIQRFSEWTPYEHRVLGRIGDKYVPIPVNIDTVNAIFGLNISSRVEMDEWLKNEQIEFDLPTNSEEMAQSRVGKRLYDLIFKPYTIKQWGKTPAQLGPEVTARIPVRNNWDDRYFNDVFQALPVQGYTKMFENILENPLIETVLNIDYFDVKDNLKCGHTYFSGPIDHYFAHLGYDKLEYRSLNFERKVHYGIGMDEYVLPASVVNYPSMDYDFTRVVEYKHFLQQKSNHSVLFYETSNDDGEPYYPVPNTKNIDLYSKYQDMAAKEPNVTFVGRLANYKYFNMDESILNALELFDSKAPKVGIVQHFDGDAVGFEETVQLVLGFYSWMPSRTFMINDGNSSRIMVQSWFDKGYLEVAEVPWKHYEDLKEGDILVIPNALVCPKSLVDRGIKVYIWKLSRSNYELEVRKNLSIGCNYICANFFCANVNGLNLSRSHVLVPYIKQSSKHFGQLVNTEREDIILIDFHDSDDSSEKIRTQLNLFCEKKVNNCKVISLNDIQLTQLKTLYQRSKIIVGNCLHGATSTIIEASLAGVLVLMNKCANIEDDRDFPIPREHMYSDEFSVIDVVATMLSNFEKEQAKIEGFRSLNKKYGPDSMVRDTKRFMFDLMSN